MSKDILFFSFINELKGEKSWFRVKKKIEILY